MLTDRSLRKVSGDLSLGSDYRVVTSLTWARRIPDSLVSTRGNRSAFFGVSTRRNETIWDSTVPCRVYHEYVVRTKWLLAKSFTLLELIGPQTPCAGTYP